MREKSQILSQSNFQVWYWKGAGYQRWNCLENPAQAGGSGLEQAQRLQQGGRWRVKSVQWCAGCQEYWVQTDSVGSDGGGS